MDGVETVMTGDPSRDEPDELDDPKSILATQRLLPHTPPRPAAAPLTPTATKTRRGGGGGGRHAHSAHRQQIGRAHV